MPTGDFPTKIILTNRKPFKRSSSYGMEIVKINGLPIEDGWYWFKGKAQWILPTEKILIGFDEPIYWKCVPDEYNAVPEAHINAWLEFYIYESGEFWQIRKGE
jgi:hypothetical protein